MVRPDVFSGRISRGGAARFSAATRKRSSQVCAQLGIQMVDGLGIQLLSLTPYTQHYDWGELAEDKRLVLAIFHVQREFSMFSVTYTGYCFHH